jgi:hypothetical protein
MYSQYYDEDTYFLDFNCVFRVQKMKRAFLAHLKQEKKTNLYAFIEEVEAFEKLKQPKQLIKKLDQIFNTFIKGVNKTQFNFQRGPLQKL